MRRVLIASLVSLVASTTVAVAQVSPPPPGPATPTPPTPVTRPVPPTPVSSPLPAPPTASMATSSAPTPPPPPPSAITAAEVDRDAVIKLGRFVSMWANMGSVDSLLTRADAAVGTPTEAREKLTSGLASFADQLGGETKFSDERVMIVNGQVQYWRTADYSAVPVPLVFRVMVGRSGKWRGFTVTPAEQLPAGAEEVKHP